MNFNFNMKLRSLRKDRGNTQEELAKFLGISVQSVSKWECGDGMPDISLLPRIAVFYGVSIDCLLGVDEAIKNERIEQITDEYNSIRHSVKVDGLPDVDYKIVEGIELMRRAVREIPDCWFFYQLLASDLWWYSKSLDGVEKTAVLSEAETLCRLILQNCTEKRWRNCANEILCLVLHEIGKQEEALEIAYGLPGAPGTSDFMLTFILEGEELKRQLYVCFEMFLRTLYRCAKKIEELNIDPSPLKESENEYRLKEISKIVFS